ncbi:MAG: MvaI/BcnI family restriction endonuclease [Ginsengibacter sp.]
MNFKNLLKLFSEKNCQKVYVKKLSANDNSKNQIYFGGSFDILNILPSSDITTDKDGIRKRESFKSKLDFYWLNDEGMSSKASHAQLILYPDYPEVRFSGFLLGCKNAPRDLLKERMDNRVLFLGVSEERKIYCYAVGPNSEMANEFFALKNMETHGVFYLFTILNNQVETNSRNILLKELKRIHNLGWIYSKRLPSDLQIVPCEHSNCGGFTLEAELKIPSNSKSGPDFLGWEVKNFSVKNFEKINSTIITLMDHSPTHGFFNEQGAEAFIRKYGYNDKRGRESRMNFGGTHRQGIFHNLTSLQLIIVGFDFENSKIIDLNGYIALIDRNGNIAASWSFESFIKHWTTKHANACYVPSKLKKEIILGSSKRQYSYGNKIILGSYTDVTLLFKQIYLGKIYFDPGIKLELAIEGQRRTAVKVRSSFRIKSNDLSSLYQTNELVNLNLI